MIIPYVIEDSGQGERSMDIFTRLLRDRIIFLGRPIDDEVANAVIAQLLFLRMENAKKDIKIYINSAGGSINAALAILDTINLVGCDVITYCIGQAVSAATLILAAGTAGKRYGLPHARMMLHQPYGAVGGTAADIELQAAEVSKAKSISIDLLAGYTKQPREKIAQDIEREFWMGSSEAKAYGIVDHMAEPIKREKKVIAGV